MPRVQHDTPTFENLLLAIQEKGLRITAPAQGSVHKLGNAEITVLAPISLQHDDLNNYSIVIRIVYGYTSFLFTGDAEVAIEEELLDRSDNIDVDVLKVAHHGSSTSTSQAYLDAVSPLWAVISCGIDNTYGHPHDDVMSRLAASGATVLRTDIPYRRYVGKNVGNKPYCDRILFTTPNFLSFTLLTGLLMIIYEIKNILLFFAVY